SPNSGVQAASFGGAVVLAGSNSSGVTFSGPGGTGALFKDNTGIIADSDTDIHFIGTSFTEAVFVQGNNDQNVTFSASKTFGHVVSEGGNTEDRFDGRFPHFSLAGADSGSDSILNGLVLVSGTGDSNISFTGGDFLGIIAITGNDAKNLSFIGDNFDQPLLLYGNNANGITYTAAHNGAEFMIGGPFPNSGNYTSNVSYSAGDESG